MCDYMIRAVAAKEQIRCFAITSRQLVKKFFIQEEILCVII